MEDIALLRSAHPNVRYKVGVDFFSTMSSSIWSGTFLSAYLLKKTGGSNLGVGAIESAAGIAQLLSALPVGYLADHYGKAKIGKIGMMLGLVQPLLIATAIVLQLSASRTLALFTVGVVMGGLIDGLVAGPLGALYADSVPSGARSRSYYWLTCARNVAAMAGPFLTIVYFELSENAWHLRQIEIVIIAGLTLILPAIVLSYFLEEADVDGDARTRAKRRSRRRATRANEHKAESSTGGEGGAGDCDGVSDGSDGEATEKTPLLCAHSSEHHHDEKEKRQESEYESSSTEMRGAARSYAWLIPYVLFSSDIVISMGSGMTFKFLPLFWKDDVNLSPVGVQSIFLVEPLVVILSCYLLFRLSKRIGRALVCMVSVGIAAVMLGLLTFLYYRNATPTVLIATYLIRSFFMRGAYPLRQAILMDSVPTEVRARWKSVDSIGRAGWCGSATLGGWLADKYDYAFTFFITSICQFVGGVFIWSPLLFLVPRFESPEKHSDTDSDSDSDSDSDISVDTDVTDANDDDDCETHSRIITVVESPAHDFDSSKH